MYLCVGLFNLYFLKLRLDTTTTCAMTGSGTILGLDTKVTYAVIPKPEKRIRDIKHARNLMILDLNSNYVKILKGVSPLRNTLIFFKNMANMN